MRRPSWSRMLYQREVWIDGGGKARKISEMDRSYARNVYKYLTDGERAKGVLGVISAAAFAAPDPNGDMASDAHERELESLLEAQRNPVRWMKEQPLLEALHTRAWGPEPEPDEPADDTWLVTLKVKAPRGTDSSDIEAALEQALKRVTYEVEINSIG